MTTSKHLLSVPFYRNDTEGNQCFQACIQSILGYYDLPEQTLQQLDVLTGRNPGQWTWTPQVHKALSQLGLTSTFYTSGEITEMLDVKNYLRAIVGENIEPYVKLTNIPSVQESVKWTLDKGTYEKRKVGIQEIMANLKENKPMIVLLDWSEVSEKYTSYQGHAVVITGYDDTHIYIHQSGPTNPQANMPLLHEDFMRARNDLTEHDLIVIHGVHK